MSRLSSKNQITVPVEVLRATGIQAGDELIIRATGRGRVELERAGDVVTRYAGTLGYPPGYLRRLRDEWDR